jgi:cytochrome c oxidase subunit 2
MDGLDVLPVVQGDAVASQSWSVPAGEAAAEVWALAVPLFAGAAAIWVLVISLAVYASALNPGPHAPVGARRLIVWGGIVLPTGVVILLALAGLLLLERITSGTPDLTVAARGEQWWWRIAHRAPDGTVVPTPNELRLPAGRTAEIELGATRVIHSFWAPPLGGKIDMIPGRTTRMLLKPERPGTWRGQCAEFCGESHAIMAFPVIVMEPAAFRDWLDAQARPAAPPATEAARRGRALFEANGCGACHAVRGTGAGGSVGPDLTHLGSRTWLAAGALPLTAEALAIWILDPDAVKPGARMPGYPMLSDAERADLAAYLLGLT